MRRNRIWIALVVLGAAALLGFQAVPVRAPAGDPIVAGLNKATLASVADAVDQVAGQRGFMSHDMRPFVEGRFAGRAVTSIAKAVPPEKAEPSLSVKHSVEIIDNSKPGEVAVIVMEDGADIAAIGGLMGTAAKVRGMAGMVLDGGVRDVAELRSLGLPTYARGITPGTAVGRWATYAKNVPVKCAGVTVNPGDIVVAGEDGVVVVPSAKAAEVLKRAQEIDERETKMVPMIKKHRSLQKVIELFNRI